MKGEPPISREEINEMFGNGMSRGYYLNYDPEIEAMQEAQRECAHNEFNP